jgi:hypothetical protein
MIKDRDLKLQWCEIKGVFSLTFGDRNKREATHLAQTKEQSLITIPRRGGGMGNDDDFR